MLTSFPPRLFRRSTPRFCLYIRGILYYPAHFVLGLKFCMVYYKDCWWSHPTWNGIPEFESYLVVPFSCRIPVMQFFAHELEFKFQNFLFDSLIVLMMM